MSIPALTRLPVVGNLREFRKDRLGLLRRVQTECGDVGAFHLGPRRVIVVSAPALAEEILVTQAAAFEKGPTMRRYARPLLGDGLLTVENAHHKRRRRLMQPAFLQRQVAAHVPAMAADAERAQAAWSDGQAIDLSEEMTALTLRIIGRALFSVDLIDEAQEVRESLEIVQRHVTGQLKRLVPLPLGWPAPGHAEVRRALERLDETIFRMIAERRAAPDAGHDLLSLLVRGRDEDDGAGLSDAQLRDEAMNLFVAGHETTAYALAWTWHCLMSHPADYDAVVAEVDRVLAGRAPTAADLDQLPLTAQAFKESLRLYPPVHSLGRQASRPVQLGPHALEAGAIVLVSTWLMQRRADLFPDPDAFRPQRFAPDVAIPRFAYLPFGAGPRVCIGGLLATQEAITVLATLLQRVRFTPTRATTDPEMLITLRPHHGLPARVSRR